MSLTTTPITTPADRDVQKKHLYSLDLLRGFAALSVCILHFTCCGLLPHIQGTILTPMFNWGYLGVEIFFIISGFIIPYALDRSNYRINEFFSFMGKRILRICPPSYVSLFLIIAQRLVIDYVINHDRTYTGTLSFYQILNNLLYTAPYTNTAWINGVFWTLAVEFQYYLLIGLCFSWIKKGIFPVIIFAVVSNIIKAWDLLPAVYFFKFNLYFVLGILIWICYAGRINYKVFWACAVLILSLIAYQFEALAAVFSLVTLLCILFFNIKSSVFTFFGNISYSLYLVHHVVGTTIEAFWIKLFPVVTFQQKLLLLLGCLTGTIIAAYIFHLTIETFFVRLAEKIFRKKKAVTIAVA